MSSSSDEGTGGGVLWISAERPDPRLSGGNIRQHHLLSALAQRVPTDLLLLGETELADAPVRPLLRAVHERVLPPRADPGTRVGAWALNAYLAARPLPREIWFHAGTLEAGRTFLRQGTEQWDAVVVEHAFLAPLGADLDGVRSILTMHNVPSVAATQQVGLVRGRRRVLARREALAWAALERRDVARFDTVVAVSQSDADQLGRDAVVVPNGVDCGRFSVREESTAGEPVVLFLGHLAFPPNVDGACWLAREIWPEVLGRVPQAHLELVGRAPHADVAAAAGEVGAALHADVPEVEPYLRRACLMVVPLRFGTGTRLKALEAMAAGVPVVGTTIGLEGLGVVDGEHALVRDTAQGLAAAVVALLEDASLRRRLARAGRELATRHDWSVVASDFVEVVLAGPRHGQRASSRR